MEMFERAIGKLLDMILPSKVGFAVMKPGELTTMWIDLEHMEPKLAVLEADKLVDVVLKKGGVRGESIGERLRKIESLVNRSIYNDMWEAHKVRNQLAHEVGYHVEPQKARDAIWKMKRFLVALGAFKND